MAVLYYDWISHHANRTPNRIAVNDLDTARRFTYREFDDRISRLAQYLRTEFSVSRGDRIAVLAQNTTDTLEIQFACARLNAMFVPLNWRLSDPELSEILSNCSPTTLFHDLEFTQRSVDLARKADIRYICARGLADSPYEQAIANAMPLCGLDQVTHDDSWTIFYTSGTTGLPKGAIVTFGGATWHTVNATSFARITHDTVYFCVLPLFHAGAMYFLINPVFHAGGTVVLMRNFDPGEALRHIGDPTLGITHLFAIPTHYLFMAQHPEFPSIDLSHVRFAGVGGAPTPLALLQAWERKGLALSQAYGLTEGLGVTALDPEEAARKSGSSGKPVLHGAVRIVDVDGNDAAIGETGEIWIKGPNVTPGYWNNPEITKASFSDGWFRTGDAARMDEEGYFYIVDRWKDMYISGGENVYPAEVENVIHQIEAVAEAAVIGVPDAKWGEVGWAIVVLKAGQALSETELLEHCAGRLARYKLPQSVVFVDALPHNATGKIHKPTLRRQFGGT